MVARRSSTTLTQPSGSTDMFNTSTESIIGRLVDQAMPRLARNPEYLSEGLRFTNGILIDVALEVSDPDTGKVEKRFFYVAFCGNVSVFVARRDQPGTHGLRHFAEIPSEEWENASNHDSCWRSDGLRFLSDNYFTMCGNVNPDKAPKQLDSDSQVGFISLWHDVVMTTAPSGADDYRRKLVSIEYKT